MYRLIDLVLTNRELDPSERMVLVYLAWRANQEGVCWPSTKAIAQGTGFSRVGVQQILKRLRDKGYLTWEPGERSSVYRLDLGRLRAMAGATADDGDANEVSIRATIDEEDAKEISTPAKPLSTPAAINEEDVKEISTPANELSILGIPHANSVSTPMLSRLAPHAKPVSTNPSKNPPKEPDFYFSSPPPNPPHDSGGGLRGRKMTMKEEERVMTEKIPKTEAPRRGTHGDGAAPLADKHDSGGLKDFLAAALGTIPSTAMVQVPEAPAEMVRALRGAGVWDRLVPLRRYARDQRAWFSWLAGPLATMWRSAPEAFPAAIGEALDALASRPEVRDPLSYLLAVARKRLSPGGGAPRSGEEPAARALRLLRGGQEPSDEDLTEFLRQRGVPTKAGVGRYNGLSSDGEWVYARLGDEVIAVPKREVVRRLMEGGYGGVTYVG